MTKTRLGTGTDATAAGPPASILVAAATILLLSAPARAEMDSVTPGSIRDLGISGNSASSLTLRWTSPGDDGDTGTATSYDVRFATTPIDSESTFASATRAIGAPPPKVAGSSETFTVSGLKKASIYYFSVKASDEVGNLGTLSNEATGNTRFEGYGHAVGGGSGGDVFHVTSLADAGPGTLREGITQNRAGPRTIVFDVAGTITLRSDINIRASAGTDHVTIDGATAPHPGITIRKQPCPSGLTSCPSGHVCLTDGEFKIGANESTATEQVIVSNLRFRGNYELAWGACDENSGATLGVQYHFRDIVLDHLTIRNGVDASPDLWTGLHHSSNVTYSFNLIAFSNHPLTISDSGGGGSRNNLTLHHNVLARSRERMPQVRGDTNNLDFRNNIVFDWSSYGMRIPNDDGQAGARKVDANIVNNYFIPGNGNPRHAFYYATAPGSQSSPSDGDGGPPSCTVVDGCARCPAQSTVVTTSFMGELWVSGNALPNEACEKYSTIGEARPTPADARVETTEASTLIGAVLPEVGTRYRLADEQDLIDEIAAAMGGVSLRPPANLRIIQPGR